jgi:hypothetical protein
LPCYLVIFVFQGDVFAMWTVFTSYAAMMSGVFFLRFRGGRWRSLRVIEDDTPPLGGGLPAARAGVPLGAAAEAPRSVPNPIDGPDSIEGSSTRGSTEGSA